MSFPLQRKTTLQTATTIATTSVDPNLRQKYGTSVDEFMSREHQKEIQKKIGELRQQFQVINKDKNSYISKEELVDFFSLNNQYNEVYYYFYFEKVKQNSKIKEEDLIIAFINSGIKTNSLTSLIFPSLMYELLFSHIEILIQEKEKIKQYIHHSLTNAKWAIKVLSLQEKQKIKQQYHSDLSDILSDLSFTDNELSKEYNSIINYLKKK